MVAVKSEDADSLLARLPPEISLTLIHGTDTGLIAERVRLISNKLGVDAKDPFQTVRLDGGEIAGDPAKLLDETNTVGLFGATRVIFIEAGAADISTALEIALRDMPSGVKIVVEAGALKKESPVRSLCEKNRAALSIECVQDREIDILRLLDAEFLAAGISVDTNAKSAIIKALGSDRLSTRSELEKLVTFAYGSKTLSNADIQMLLSEASTVALEDIINFAFSGDVVGVEESWRTLHSAAGPDGSTILGNALREAIALHQYCSSDNRGSSYGGGLQRYARGFGRKPLSPENLKKWSIEKSVRALDIVGIATANARRDPSLSQELAIRALWSVAYLCQR